MSKAKIRLSQKEQELVIDASFILTKNAILEKVKLLLLDVLENQQVILQSPQLFLENDWETLSAKISKGENYKGLPYLILDYPRCFGNSSIFAIRTMFWWGNFFSITLQLAGDYKKTFEEKIIDAIPKLTASNFFLCINEDQWQHDFEATNYLSLTSINNNELEKYIREKPFIKIATKIPIHQWDKVPDILSVYFNQLIEMLEA